jgi:hypothetical protein
MDFSDINVRHTFELLHRDGLCHRFLHRFVDQELTTPFRQPVHGGTHPEAEQGIAGAKVVIKERKRRTDRECVQPKGNFGEFNGHRIAVHAINAPLEDGPSNDVPVVEMFDDERPAMLGRLLDNVLSRCLDGMEHW